MKYYLKKRSLLYECFCVVTILSAFLYLSLSFKVTQSVVYGFLHNVLDGEELDRLTPSSIKGILKFKDLLLMFIH